MTEVIIFNSKEDGAEYYRTGKKTYLSRKTFKTIPVAVMYAWEKSLHLEKGQSIVIGEVKEEE